ncbi:MAG TPA: hypothetical protein VMD08_17770 [Candidatus Baltobacteraceae bacterium]|nr:hypothetical protein [Candidatus Baltobacteraceae bacterium]
MSHVRTINWQALLQALIAILEDFVLPPDPAPTPTRRRVTIPDRAKPLSLTRRAPREHLLRGRPYRPYFDTAVLPATFANLDAKLSIFENDALGDCDSAEECQNINTAWGVIIANATLTPWLIRHGFLDGAYSQDVLRTMAKVGILQGGVLYKDGDFTLVDPKNWDNMRSALYSTVGTSLPPTQIKLDIDGDAIIDKVDLNQPFSIITNLHPSTTVNHCTAVVGFGTAAALLDLLNQKYQSSIVLPPQLDPNTPCYVHFTWGQYQIIDAASLANIADCGYLRTPGSIQIPAKGGDAK